MTIGIGGWGSRRKPMSLVIVPCCARSRDLTIVSYGGPDRLPARRWSGQVRGWSTVRVAGLDRRREPQLPGARQAGAVGWPSTTRHAAVALSRPPHCGVVPPARAGLGADVDAVLPQLRTVIAPKKKQKQKPTKKKEQKKKQKKKKKNKKNDYCDYSFSPSRRCRSMPALVHLNRSTSAGNAQFSRALNLYFLRPVCRRLRSLVRLCERIGPPGSLAAVGGVLFAARPRWMVPALLRPATGALHACAPDYGRTRRFPSASTRRRRRNPASLDRVRRGPTCAHEAD